MGSALIRGRWYPTVHDMDQYAYDFWHEAIGIPVDRIRKLGDEENWWGPVGETGPDGPDSEIYFDRGPELAADDRIAARPANTAIAILETWNLVFMEFYKERTGRSALCHARTSIQVWGWSASR